jgi:hypothetical protein
MPPGEVSMFQVKATVVGFMGDEKKYPCHFQHKIGDKFIYDGEKYIGRICPGFSAMLIPRMMDFYAAGPRLVPSPQYYLAFWYAPVSRKDDTKKKYDGIGFRNVLKTAVEPPRHMARLQPEHAFDWPPDSKRTVLLDNSIVVCRDTRTSLMMKIEAFDLADKGDSLTYFRREMSILNKVIRKPGIELDRVLGEFTRKEIEDIYPALSPILLQILSEELELMDYLRIKNGRTYVTAKGEAKLKAFRKSLTKEERQALRL